MPRDAAGRAGAINVCLKTSYTVLPIRGPRHPLRVPIRWTVGFTNSRDTCETGSPAVDLGAGMVGRLTVR